MIFKRINFGLVIFMLVSSLVLSIVEYIDISRFFIYIGLIASICLPFIFYKTNYRLSDKQLMLYYIFIFFADYLGCVWKLYDYIGWYDVFVHFIAGIFIYILGMFILKVNKLDKKFIFSVFFCLIFVMGISGLWEVFEFSVDQLFGLDMQNVLYTGVRDTMEDMIIAFVGGIFYCEYLILQVKQIS